MALIGEDLKDSLQLQIKTREEKLGNPLPNTSNIIYANSNTSWIRAASSVDVINGNTTHAGLNDLGIIDNGKGNKFANEGILFGGVSTNNSPSSQFQAFTTDYDLESQQSGKYGWGGNYEKWGFSPPPAIQSITIKSLNRGAIRKAELNILVHNPDQFRIIDALYLRLGFTILVEWGHSVYYDNNGNLVQNPIYNTRPFDTFMGNPQTTGTAFQKQDVGVPLETPGQDLSPLPLYAQVTQEIEAEKERQNFNYGGFIGHISNFNWSYNKDNTYNINLSVITRGGLIDSLTMNHTSNSSKSNSEGYTHIFSEQLNTWKELANSDNLPLSSDRNSNITYNAASMYEDNENFQNQKRLFKDVNFKKDGELLQIVFNNPSSKQVYCSLSLLFRLIKEKCLFYDETFNPIININAEYNTSFMLTHPFQSSLNPAVCVIPSTTPLISVTKKVKREGKEEKIVETETAHNILGGIENSFRTDNPFKGDIMGILVNLNYVTDTFNNALNTEGDVPLNTFIENLFIGINKSIGSLNSFHLSYDDTINEYQIYDDNTIPGTETKTPPQGQINVYRNKEEEVGLGSFVKDFKISSKIFPKIQNAVAIAAQNPDEGTIGEKVGSYQRLNRGLKDRISNGTFQSHEDIGKEKEDFVPYKKYEQIIYNISKHLKKTYIENKYPEIYNIKDLESSFPKVLTGDLQWRSKEKEISPPFFVPIEISLTLHGLSGFKLFQKFDIGPDYIFPSYIPKNLNYIIQGITHDLKSNEWTTTLNTLCWTADPLPNQNPIALEYPIVGCPTTVASPSPVEDAPPENPTPNADRLREILKNLGYNEKGNQIANAGDITSEMADYAIRVFTTIKSERPDINVRVTGGNDLFHQNVPYISRHSLGRGLDFVITPVNVNNVNEIETILKGFAAGNYALARYLNEYSSPSKQATGDHFHISWGAGTEAQNEIDLAKAEGENNQFDIYQI